MQTIVKRFMHINHSSQQVISKLKTARDDAYVLSRHVSTFFSLEWHAFVDGGRNETASCNCCGNRVTNLVRNVLIHFFLRSRHSLGILYQ